MSEPDTGKTGIYIGKTAIYRNPFMLDTKENINPHIAIIGMTGSGKTYFVKSMVMRAALYDNYKILIVDWSGEYTLPMDFIEGTRIQLGASAGINIFELYRNDKAGIGYVIDIIAHELELDRKERNSVEDIINNITESKKEVSLSSIIACLNGRMETRALARRLRQLDGNPIFKDTTDFDKKTLLNSNMSIDLSAIKNDRQRTAVSRAILSIAIDTMHEKGVHGNGKVIIVIDEAWHMLSGSNELFTLLREGRKYGVSIVVATQMAADINNAVIANAGCIIAFRLQGSNDYSILETAGALGDISAEDLSHLSIGSCMVHVNKKYGKSSSFIIAHVDGVDIDEICIVGDKMQIYVSSSRFFSAAEVLGERAKAEISNFIIDNNRRADITALIRLLIKCGLDRPHIIWFLHTLGIDNLSIAVAYEKAAPSDYTTVV